MNKNKEQFRKLTGKKRKPKKSEVADYILSNPQANLLLVKSLRRQLQNNKTHPLTRNQLIGDLKVAIRRLEASAKRIRQNSL